MPSPMPTAASAYDASARTIIVAEQREDLLAHAIASRAESEETLCLMASRAPTTAESLIIGICIVPDAKAAWRRGLSVANQSGAMDVDKLFSESNADDLAGGVQGAIVKDPIQDAVVWKEYLETVVKAREGWEDLYKACRAIS